MGAQDLIKLIEADYMKQKLPEIYTGDTVRVGIRIREGGKERVQPFEGTVIAQRNGGINRSITVRKIFQGVGVERVFLIHSPKVESISIVKRGKTRRSKLYYLRNRVGKATRLKERFDRPLSELQQKNITLDKITHFKTREISQDSKNNEKSTKEIEKQSLPFLRS